jgi:dimethylhistidine N-methyltransferase
VTEHLTICEAADKSDRATLEWDVLSTLSQQPKALSSRWLYDRVGSELFEEITRLPEYYPTRVETSILRRYAADIARFAGDGAVLLEYGAGAGIKTELILNALQNPRAYVPIDIAGDFLGRVTARYRQAFPNMLVAPILSDFTAGFEIPPSIPTDNRVGFFPGSTIGNLDADQAVEFLGRLRAHTGSGGRAIIGADMKKDIDTLIAAYDDKAGVTARFNLNLLTRLNRELDSNFIVDLFRHSARWNETESAIEMHLESLSDQRVTIAGRSFEFAEGETIHTETSRKYDVADFTELAAAGGWDVARVWKDDVGLFSVFGLA